MVVRRQPLPSTSQSLIANSAFAAMDHLCSGLGDPAATARPDHQWRRWKYAAAGARPSLTSITSGAQPVSLVSSPALPCSLRRIQSSTSRYGDERRVAHPTGAGGAAPQCGDHRALAAANRLKVMAAVTGLGPGREIGLESFDAPTTISLLSCHRTLFCRAAAGKHVATIFGLSCRCPPATPSPDLSLLVKKFHGVPQGCRPLRRITSMPCRCQCWRSLSFKGPSQSGTLRAGLLATAIVDSLASDCRIQAARSLFTGHPSCCSHCRHQCRKLLSKLRARPA